MLSRCTISERSSACSSPRTTSRAAISECRIDVADADRLAVMIDDRADFAGLECGQRRARDIDLVREHPQMPRAQARVLAALQKQRRIFDSGSTLSDPFAADAHGNGSRDATRDKRRRAA